MCDVSGSSEEDTQVESFESGLARLAREADPGKGQRKAAKNKKRSKNAQKKKKKNKRNKRKGLKGKKGGKGQKQRKKNRKNSARSGKGKKKSEKKKNKKKAERRQKKKKNGEKKRKNKNKAERRPKKKNGEKKRKNGEKRMNTAQARDSTCLSTTCVDNAVKAMKLMKDKVVNFEKQDKRISSKSRTGGKKSAKQDVFKPVLQRLSDAAGGNISAPVCSGNSTSAGAAQMLNLSMTLKSCDDDIHAACDTSNLPTPNATMISECKAAITIFKNYTDTCQDLSGSAACDCWSPSANVTAAMAIVKTCDISKNNTAMVNAVKDCKAAFGKCRKYEDAVGDIIFACEQSADTLKLKLKALSENSDKVAAVASKVEGIVNGSSRSYGNGKFKRSDDATTATGYISICTQINTYVVQNPYYYQIATLSTTIISVTTPTFTAANLIALSAVNTALQVSVTTLQVAVTTLQTTILGK